MYRLARHALAGVATALATVTVAVVAMTATTAAVAARHAATAAKKGGKGKTKGKSKKPEKKPAGPSMSVIGFGVNRIFLATGAKLTSEAKCSEMVDGNGGPIGPPQETALVAYVRATDISDDAPTQFSDVLPDDDGELEQPTLSTAAPWSKVFEKGPFFFGNPSDETDLFHYAIATVSPNFNSSEGPSPEEYDGDYSFTASVEVGGHTLTSTASITVDCPMYR